MQGILVHRIFSPLKSVLPVPVARFVRGVATAVLTPFYGAYRSGHFISSLRAKAVDKSGKPIIWYTYPAIEFLSAKSYDGCKVLEFGAGHSTLWWSARAAQVMAYEENESWYGFLKNKVAANVDLRFRADVKLPALETEIRDLTFDIVIVDGFDRFLAVEKAIAHLAKDGMLILDNSEGYWGEEGTYPIVDLLHQRGMMRVDFYGHSPANVLPSCTSIFFRDRARIFRDGKPPVRD